MNILLRYLSRLSALMRFSLQFLLALKEWLIQALQSCVREISNSVLKSVYTE